MSKSKILIVEKDWVIAEDIKQDLEALDYEVVAIVKTGRQAIETVDKTQPDLVLMDILLPGKIESSLAAEEIDSRYQTPVIYLIDQADKNLIYKLKHHKSSGYLIKPFKSIDLHSTIEIALHQYHYDSLTNLPNRFFFQKKLNQLLKTYQKTNVLIPILSLSLDRINRINGTFGHSIGNFVLQSISQKLIRLIPGCYLLSRLEAAEFAMVLEPIHQKQEAAKIAQIILDIIAQPIAVKGYEFYLTASIGISFYPSDGLDDETLLKNAYTAMYYSQQNWENYYQFYLSSIDIVSVEKLALETHLRNALERDQFIIYYQPQVDLITGQIIGAEALLRWRHPERGIISPIKFIELAEEIGLIIPIGEWVLRTACYQNKAWQDAGFSMEIGVNLSARQFYKKNIEKTVIQIIEETGMNPQLLNLEISESLLINNEKIALEIFKEWQQFGIEISLDDFGTGYSSLSYLKRFTFNIIKIDQSFINNLQDSYKHTTIVLMIIQLAHRLNMKVIAEGVETEAELMFLKENFCDAIQGYFFSRPLPANEFEALLISGKKLDFPDSSPEML